MNTLGERLLMARKAKKMTQQELAKKARVAQATVSDIERGRNQTTIEAPALAKALGVSVDYLLLGKEVAYDFMGLTELAGNLFRVTQTAERIKHNP